MGRADVVGFELRAVVLVDHPNAGGLQVLARGGRGDAADYRGQVLAAWDLHLEDGEAILRIVVGDPLDLAGDGFGHWRFGGLQ